MKGTETRTGSTAEIETRTEGGATGAAPRRRLLADLPVEERRLELGGVSTPVLEAGAGDPIVLLHGPGEFALKWMRVIPALAESHRVVAPDLPGHGASRVASGPLDADAVLEWLGALIDETCASPPALVGQIVGGAIAARFASERPEAIDRLVLADSLGLRAFQPAPEFGQALNAFLAGPSAETHEGLWRRCAHDFDRLRDGMGERWSLLEAYNLDRANDPGVRSNFEGLMEDFGLPAIPPEILKRIAVPTTLIWGRHDLATPLEVAEAARDRYGWPLHVIEGAADDPALERPEAFVEALRAALEGR